MVAYKFTVDAELLRELGERLVGRPYIALAELIKNAYDADATAVVIQFDEDLIVVTDNGHGMSPEDFRRRWMRIGTTNKRGQAVSPLLGRRLTGSKGVGRLAAQLLARQTTIDSTALIDPNSRDSLELHSPISASIDWDEAVASGELTAVTVEVDVSAGSSRYANESPYGTRVSMSRLSQTWGRAELTELAREIWALQPPFENKVTGAFSVQIEAPDDTIVHAFDTEMSRVFDLWTGRVSGHLLPADYQPSGVAQPLKRRKLPAVRSGGDNDVAPESGQDTQGIVEGGVSLPTRHLAVEIQVRGEEPRNIIWAIDACEIDEVEFDIRVFALSGRQRHHLPVNEARRYISQFGGVGLYDSGFRLPNYGSSEDDWLSLDSDSSRRLSASRLLPQDLQVAEGLQDLPGNRNLLGWVSISTNHEQAHREKNGPEGAANLAIQVTRDRLVENAAFHRLRVMVRASIDLYAMERARVKIRASTPSPSPSGGGEVLTDPSVAARSAISTLRSLKSDIPVTAFETIETALVEVRQTTERARNQSKAYAALLGTLATTGMTSLAYEHEISKQVRSIRYAAERLESSISGSRSSATDRVISEVAASLRDWEVRAIALRQIFGPLLRPETRDEVKSYRARSTVADVSARLQILARQAPVDTTSVPEDLKLPEATYPAWSSVFQNILINAFNALHDEQYPRVVVDGGGDDDRGWIRFMDNGAGVDLQKAESLWEPFERALRLPPALEQAGLGGMGLGLAIVKMILDELGVRAAFEPPPAGFNTALRIRWGKR